MAIEIGIYHNGSSDLPGVEIDGQFFNKGSLADTQEAATRTLIGQVRQGVLADRLGFDGWYPSEHHFQPEGAEFSPNPINMEMTIAGLTKRIRLAQAANIIVWHHPVRFAEQAAMLDIVSGGRADVGIGRGYQPRETETLGRPYGATTQDQERNRVAFEEAYEIIIKAWTEGSFSYHGENFSIPPKHTKWNHAQTMAFFKQDGVGRSIEDVLDVGPPDMYSSGAPIMNSTTRLKEISVYPQPIQKPYPQCWAPMTSSRSIKWAAERGINGFFTVEPASRLKNVVDSYHEAAAAAGFPDRLDRGEFKRGWDCEKRRGLNIVRSVHVQERGIGNLDKAAEGVRAQWSFYQQFGFASFLAEADEPLYDPMFKVTPEFLREKEIYIHGSKEHVIDSILRLKEAIGADDFCFSAWFDLAGHTSEETEEQMSYFAEEISPVLRRECGGGAFEPVESDVELVPGPALPA